MALGFPPLRIGSQSPDGSECNEDNIILTLGPSQLKNLRVGGPLVSFLLTHLCITLNVMFGESKYSRHNTLNTEIDLNQTKTTCTSNGDDFFGFIIDNPYNMTRKKLLLTNEKFLFLSTCISGEVFISIHEHLATVAELGGESNIDDNGRDFAENVTEIQHCVHLLFRCVISIVEAEELSYCRKNRVFLEAIFKQLAEGVHIDIELFRKESSIPGLMGSILNIFELLEEIIIERKSCCLELSMDGGRCLDSLLQLSKKITHAGMSQTNFLQKKDSSFALTGVYSLNNKVSTLCLELLKTKWPENTKFNKSNIGKLVELYIDNSWCSMFNRDIDNI